MSLSHRVTRMTGRDPHESHRAATPARAALRPDVRRRVQPDLVAGRALPRARATSATALGGFAFTHVRRHLGVDQLLVARVGLRQRRHLLPRRDARRDARRAHRRARRPAVFDSLAEGEHLDNGVMVAGYVVMRVATVALWLRAAKHDPARRRTALAYAVEHRDRAGRLGRADLPQPADRHDRRDRAACSSCSNSPVRSSRRCRYGRTPWHPHHIAERYGLLVIITLGEVVLGTILAISAVVQRRGMDARGGPHRARRHDPRVRAVVELLHDAVGPDARPPSRAGLRSGATGTSSCSARSIGVGRGPARRRPGHRRTTPTSTRRSRWRRVAIPVLVFEIMLFALYTLLVVSSSTRSTSGSSSGRSPCSR